MSRKYSLIFHVLGNFSNCRPHGQGELWFKNGDRCVGTIEGKMCTGQMKYSFGGVENGSFGWTYDHTNHTFIYGE
jgi:hypothetical protein